MRTGTEETNNKINNYKIMLEQRLVFFPGIPESLNKLIAFVQRKNYKRYKNSHFEYVPSQYDLNLFIAATPELGEEELGVFAGKEFQQDEIIACYLGENSGVKSSSEIKKSIDSCHRPGDYFFEVSCKKGKAMTVDAMEVGSISRFLNDSLHKNAYAVFEQNKLIIKAQRKIQFCEEITINYGSSYFNKNFPRIGYNPALLQTLLLRLFELKFGESLSEISMHNKGDIQIFLDLLGWNDIPSNMVAKISLTKNKYQGTLPLPESRIENEKTELYVDEKNNPLLFDLSNPDSVKELSVLKNLKFHKTSEHQLFIAPTGRVQGMRRLSLFTATTIKNNQAVFVIEGENLSSRQLKSLTDCDENLVYVLNSNTNIYCKNESSEVHFLQGAYNPADANVRMIRKKGRAPTYFSTKEILPGDEILAYFGERYCYGTQNPTNLSSVVYGFNQCQTAWNAFLHYDVLIMKFSLTLAKNAVKCKTENSPATYDEKTSLPPQILSIKNFEPEKPYSFPTNNDGSDDDSMMDVFSLNTQYMSMLIVEDEPLKFLDELGDNTIKFYPQPNIMDTSYANDSILCKPQPAPSNSNDDCPKEFLQELAALSFPNVTPRTFFFKNDSFLDAFIEGEKYRQACSNKPFAYPKPCYTRLPPVIQKVSKNTIPVKQNPIKPTQNNKAQMSSYPPSKSKTPQFKLNSTSPLLFSEHLGSPNLSTKEVHTNFKKPHAVRSAKNKRRGEHSEDDDVTMRISLKWGRS